MGKCVSIFRRPRRDRFDASNQSINSIDRGVLNEELIGEVERAGVPIFFKHKLQSANFDGKKLQFATPSGQEPSTEVEVDFDFCVGADGSHSNVRRQLMRVLRYAISHTIRKPRVLTLSKLMGLDSTVWIISRNIFQTNIWNCAFLQGSAEMALLCSRWIQVTCTFGRGIHSC